MEEKILQKDIQRGRIKTLEETDLWQLGYFKPGMTWGLPLAAYIPIKFALCLKMSPALRNTCPGISIP